MKLSPQLRHPPPPKKILIVDDHPMTRHGLAVMISREPDLTVCGEAADAQQALAAIDPLQPDLVLADITMPGKSGLEFIKDMAALHPGVAVLVISMHEETIYAERVLRAGGRGYVMKSEGGEKVLEAIRKVLRGEIYTSLAFSDAILGTLAAGRSRIGDVKLGALTDREFEIFRLIGQGYSSGEISQRLNLSVKTVSTHRVHIKQKLQLTTGTALVRHAVRWAGTEQML
jgi:DNA-binding NarL/FixJ family response regulator